MKEADIQFQIIKYLEKIGWYPVKIIQTNKNGWPDLQALSGGHCVFIEVKSEKGIVSELQKYRHKQLAKQGFHTIITTNLKEFINDFSIVCESLHSQRYISNPN
jgi:hypothetical protein